MKEKQTMSKRKMSHQHQPRELESRQDGNQNQQQLPRSLVDHSAPTQPQSSIVNDGPGATHLPSLAQLMQTYETNQFRLNTPGSTTSQTDVLSYITNMDRYSSIPMQLRDIQNVQDIVAATRAAFPEMSNAQINCLEGRVIQLVDNLGVEIPRGLNRNEIDKLPSYKLSLDSRRVGDRTSCVFCMCDFKNEQVLRVLPCLHEFHATCVDKWLKGNQTCPICRQSCSEKP